MRMSELTAEKISYWLHHHFEPDKVKKELDEGDFSEEEIEFYLKEFKKQYYAKRQKTGFIFLLIGAFAGFLSCVLSISNPFPEMYETILFGMTSISLIIIFIGLYFLFE